MEIALLYAPVDDVDLALQRGSQAENQATLELRDDCIRIDDNAGVDR